MVILNQPHGQREYEKEEYQQEDDGFVVHIERTSYLCLKGESRLLHSEGAWRPNPARGGVRMTVKLLMLLRILSKDAKTSGSFW